MVGVEMGYSKQGRTSSVPVKHFISTHVAKTRKAIGAMVEHAVAITYGETNHMARRGRTFIRAAGSRR